MRQHRPEIFSDTIDRPLYLLDRSLLEYQLETLTARNEHQKFEIFSRKLCERVICPNIRPQSGPEGGGDGKTDADTYPVSDRISELYFSADAAPSSGILAFAFSAMKDWKRKVTRDVEGILSTGRSYERIYFVTSRAARAKDRAQIETSLSAIAGVPVHVLDRAWIANEVIDHERKDLAYDYLGVGQLVNDPMRLGPEDYSRRYRLDAIERAFNDPQHFAGMESQMVIEAILACCLSREIEAPRHETDGRHARAIRLAKRYGTQRQMLEARHDALWTAFWWFDDARTVSEGYREVEEIALAADHVRNVEYLVQLHQLLVNAVVYRMLSIEACAFDARSKRLEAVLSRMAQDVGRPNHRLEARTSLAIVQVGRLTLARAFDRFPEIWAELGDILNEAEGLAEYDTDRLVRLIEAMGQTAGRDPAYMAIAGRLAEFIAKRTSDSQSALVILRHAINLGSDARFEQIRLLGRAAMRLGKREHAEAMVEAQQHLAIAYRGADLLWAARSSCLFAVAGLAAQSEEEGSIPAGFVPTVKMWAWIALQLRLIPEFIMAVQLLGMSIATAQLDEPSRVRMADAPEELDAAFACTIMNMSEAELQLLSRLPDALKGAGLGMARMALLYALGHEEVLREDGSFPASESDEEIRNFLALMKAQPISAQVTGPLILNREQSVTLESCICGMVLDIRAPGSTITIGLAQALAATFEAMLATLLEEKIAAHTERFRIDIVEHDNEPVVRTDPVAMRAMVSWPRTRSPHDFARQKDLGHFLIQVASEILAAAFFVPDIEATLLKLFEQGDAHARVSCVMGSMTSLERITGKPVLRLDDEDLRDYPPGSAAAIPHIELPDPSQDRDADSGAHTEEDGPAIVDAHRGTKVRSVIDVRCWDQARWAGIAYASFGEDIPPVFALHFKDRIAARQIFERWRERFGEKDERHEIRISLIRMLPQHPPSHYAVQITSGLPDGETWDNETLYQVMHRVHVMEPADDGNLSRFLGEHRAFGCYLIAPAVTQNGKIDIMTDLAILKRDLPVIRAADIQSDDIERVALELVMERVDE